MSRDIVKLIILVGLFTTMMVYASGENTRHEQRRRDEAAKILCAVKGDCNDLYKVAHGKSSY